MIILSKADYRGELYDLGYDKPETHVIQKGDTFYYAFYADKWNGPIELRGLNKNKSYKVIDYVDEKKIGEITGTSPILNYNFDKYLLIKVVPVD